MQRILSNGIEKVGPGSTVLVASLPEASVIGDVLGVDPMEEIYIANWCVAYGKKYQGNMLVVTGKNDDLEPVFPQIVYVVCLDDGIKLVSELLHTVKSNRHTHSYIVRQPLLAGLWSMHRVEDLLDFQPYHAAKSYDQSEESHLFIVVRHRIH